LTWTDNSTNENGFYIERANEGSNFVQVGSVSADKTTYLDTNLRSNKRYSYRVRAYNQAGTSGYSNVVNVRTPRR